VIFSDVNWKKRPYFDLEMVPTGLQITVPHILTNKISSRQVKIILGGYLSVRTSIFQNSCHVQFRIYPSGLWVNSMHVSFLSAMNILMTITILSMVTILMCHEDWLVTVKYKENPCSYTIN
jgi:hypothetical protein